MSQSIPFPKFPKFRALTYADKDVWNDLIADYPPIAEYSFFNLMSWWSTLEKCKVSELNGNLIISYWLPEDTINSGLSVLGRNLIDETICAIFDWQKMQGYVPRLVLVPEFVMQQINYPEMYIVEPQVNHEEYILSVDVLARVSSLPEQYKKQIRRFNSKYKWSDIEIKKLKIYNNKDKQLLLNSLFNWRNEGKWNDLGEIESQCIRYLIINGHNLGCEALALFFQDEIHAFSLFVIPEDKRYVIESFGRFSYKYDFVESLMINSSAIYYKDKGIKYINIDIDLGIDNQRGAQLQLKPYKFFKKYTIKPRS